MDTLDLDHFPQDPEGINSEAYNDVGNDVEDDVEGVDEEVEDAGTAFAEKEWSHENILLLLTSYEKFQEKMDQGRHKKVYVWRWVRLSPLMISSSLELLFKYI